MRDKASASQRVARAFAFFYLINAKCRSSSSPSNHSLQTLQLIITTHCFLGVETFTPQEKSDRFGSVPSCASRTPTAELLSYHAISRVESCFDFLISLPSTLALHQCHGYCRPLACIRYSAFVKVMEKVLPFVVAPRSSKYFGPKIEDKFK